MKKLLVYLDEDLHEDLRELAHQKRTTMSELVRQALDATFDEELDVIGGLRALQEAVSDPASSTSWEAYKAERAERVRNSTRAAS